ncbi:MAG TPA: hypothetical protein VFA52_01090 [Candidatus Paceibacterota bacterium]|nr:hypothetical protein [Candidatus Paceibacterota bacterium]
MKRSNLKAGLGPLIIILIVAVALALGGGVYYSVHHAPATTVSNDTSANVSVSGQASNGTLRNLLAMGKNVMCTIDESTASSSLMGTMYIAGTNMRGDFTSSFNGSAKLDSHMIRNGDIMYAWSGSQGAKMTYNTSDMSNASANSKSQSNVNLDQKVNYHCSSWSPDNSKFSAPTNVNFIDINAAMHGAAGVSGNGNAGTGTKANVSAGASVSAQCSACASLSGNAKSQCLLALHC